MNQANSSNRRLGASFRDPSGFLFTHQDVLFRQINRTYQANYDQLMSSGLYRKLIKAGLLIPHDEVDVEADEPALAYKVIRPESLEFVSYPYEWSFSQLKDAALATLAIQKMAMNMGMSLKDASAYNIQFHRGRPLLIDTLSFETYREGEPWVAYRQFCQHFLAPLALMAHTDVRLSQLLRVYIDGVPLDLTSRLLPQRTRLDFGLATHIRLHAAAQRRYADHAVDKGGVRRRVSKTAFLGLVDSLESTVRKLQWKLAKTEWGDYYTASAGHYTPAALEQKRMVIGQFLDLIKPGRVWDLGANTGEFSRLASQRGIPTVAFDIDPVAVELAYQRVVKEQEAHLVPLLLDLTNPSPGIGWNNQERMTLVERGPADAVLALALIHHLAISNNVPLQQLAEFFGHLGGWLIIEFVPKDDSQVQRLLATREDIFPEYSQRGFEAAFSVHFVVHESVALTESQRRLYLMKARGGRELSWAGL